MKPVTHHSEARQEAEDAARYYDRQRDGLGDRFIAELESAYAPRVFNERRKTPLSKVYGTVSTGELWAFSMLMGKDVTLDMRVYHIDEVARILGVLVKLVTE